MCRAEVRYAGTEMAGQATFSLGVVMMVSPPPFPPAPLAPSALRALSPHRHIPAARCPCTAAVTPDFAAAHSVRRW